jgi:hypothetical protein
VTLGVTDCLRGSHVASGGHGWPRGVRSSLGGYGWPCGFADGLGSCGWAQGVIEVAGEIKYSQKNQTFLIQTLITSKRKIVEDFQR